MQIEGDANVKWNNLEYQYSRHKKTAFFSDLTTLNFFCLPAEFDKYQGAAEFLRAYTVILQLKFSDWRVFFFLFLSRQQQYALAETQTPGGSLQESDKSINAVLSSFWPPLFAHCFPSQIGRASVGKECRFPLSPPSFLSLSLSLSLSLPRLTSFSFSSFDHRAHSQTGLVWSSAWTQRRPVKWSPARRWSSTTAAHIKREFSCFPSPTSPPPSPPSSPLSPPPHSPTRPFDLFNRWKSTT